MRLGILASTILASAALLAATAAAPALAGGELRCNVAGGIGFILAGKRATTCVYYRHDGQVEFYIGSFTRIGIDTGPAQARQAIFDVGGSDAEPVGALDGDFGGVTASTSIARGGAADILVGGRNGVPITPAYNSRQAGLNSALGIGVLHLRYAGTERPRARFRGTGPDDLGF